MGFVGNGMNGLRPIVWGPEYEIGHKRIDTQHELLTNLFNRLIHAFQSPSKDRSSAIRSAFSALSFYTEIHFRKEETLMARLGYPDLDAHRAQHAEILKEFYRWIERFTSEEGVNEKSLAIAIKFWIESFPLDEADRRLGEWIRLNDKMQEAEMAQRPPVRCIMGLEEPCTSHHGLRRGLCPMTSTSLSTGVTFGSTSSTAPTA
jgi:hemerythrin-like metal-binding protein